MNCADVGIFFSCCVCCFSSKHIHPVAHLHPASMRFPATKCDISYVDFNQDTR